MIHPKSRLLTLSRLVLGLVLTAGTAFAQGLQENDATFWPEPQRSFFQDGPGLLLTPEERTDLRGLNPEARGLIEPKRSPKNTRLYSQADVERLRRIQRLTSEEGLNLAGVEAVLQMEETVEQMRAEMARMRARADELEKRMLSELEHARKSLGVEIVPYGAYEAELEPGKKIPSQRKKNR